MLSSNKPGLGLPKQKEKDRSRKLISTKLAYECKQTRYSLKLWQAIPK